MGKKSEKKLNKNTESSKHETRKIITDPRFQSLHSDPRFQNVPKHQSKITIDSRFNRMFTDKNFSSSKSQIDKRGKPKDPNSANPLRHYYKHDDEMKKSKKKMKEIESESEEEEEDDVNPEELDAEVLRVAKEENFEIDEESDDDDVEVSESSDDEDAVLFTDDESEEEEEVVENIPEIEQETRRLAVVNMDWSQIRAVDLYVVLTSFLPRGGQIISVSVYPSKFGVERMEEEAVKGPVGLFDGDDDNTKQDEDSDDDDTKQNEDSDDDNTEQKEDSDDENTEQNKDSDHDSIADEGNDELDIPKNWRAYQKIRDDSDDENIEEINISKLRAYEKSRLRYYFAVVEFDSVGTADHIYRNCDGIEFESSSNVLDLRFIPDTVKFEDPPRDVATERPTNYEAPNFQTDALQNCKIRLTWDEDDPKRKKTLRRKLNDDQLAELELNEYLASDISDDDDDDDDDVGYEEDVEEQINKMVKKLEGQRTLLQAGDDSDEEDSENDKDMEITFNTGLEDISKRILEKRNNKESETVWEAHLRRQKEKKKSLKNKSDDDSSSESDQEKAHEEPDDFFLEDPSSKKSGKSKKKKSKGKEEEDLEKDQEASRAELELLLADDQGDENNNNNVKGYNLKRKKSKGKKGKEVAVEDKIPAAEYDDPRFKSLFTSPLYALDPTDAQYKRSAAYARQIAQKQHRGVGEETEENPQSKETELPQEETVPKKIEESKPLKVENPELSSMIRSIKRKAQQYQETSKSNALKKQSNGKDSSQDISRKKKKAKISKS